ncbi:unnamed protein product [Meloidogyne enterolobii]|uniref:Uncharacterized protein n=1 Tax=Meloidogyne enterolobii TaxID=390850 RepID=A0ACB0ZZI6_MELEN
MAAVVVFSSLLLDSFDVAGQGADVAGQGVHNVGGQVDDFVGQGALVEVSRIFPEPAGQLFVAVVFGGEGGGTYSSS